MTKLSSYKKVISNNRGSSFIEILYITLIFFMIAAVLLKTFFLIHAEIMVINAAKSALRQIELKGEFDSIVYDDIKIMLSKNSNIKTNAKLDMYVNNTQPNIFKKYQLRERIEIKLVTQFDAFGFNVPLSCRYVGSSQKYHKDLGAYTKVE